ncbi:hypothetical protein H2198_006380 [Neophaeococcomyces mojaviensis]|uniref:Uncharacterized protein n=1 Tax=Neophaeococcomyces mojaviensis TaxID=3383035 RepID=A0ACC3A3L0_9EURO|nr:hypothetical protein H2198_006380 [Knufia sp. JES_112]
MDKLSLYQNDLSFSSTFSRETLAMSLTFNDVVALLLPLLGLVTYLSHGKFWAKPDPYLYKLFEKPQEQFGVSSQNHGPKDIAQQLEEQKKDIVIFWGSQSGTAERFAQRLARDCSQRFGLNVIVGDLSDYDPETISKIPETKFAIFLVSTYGEGDPSDNTTEFLDWVKKRSNSLSNLHYAAFGLGNSNYVYYNKVIDEIVQCLESLSAIALMPVGKADDADSSTEEDFISWKDDLFAMFHTRLGLEEHVPEYLPSIEVNEVSGAVETKPHLGTPQPLRLSRRAARDYSTIEQLSIIESRSLTPAASAGRNCLHLEVDLRSHPQLKYKTGDHLAVWPTNSEEEVRRILNVLGLMSKQAVEITILPAEREKNDIKIPGHSTISALFRHYLEISAPVSRDTITTLCQLAPSDMTKSFLQNLSKKSEYAAFIAHNHVTFARLLEHTLMQDPSASWTHLPLSFVIESLRPMTPRYYSISSSSMTSSRQMSITVAVSPAQLAGNPAVSVPGLTTSYLSTLRCGAAVASQAGLDDTPTPTVYAHVRRSTFKMPFLHKTPIVLIAAGTGIAPFRGFLLERAQMAQISNQEIGPVLLVFGCRNPDEDYLYRSEIEALQAGSLKGKLDIVTAFSRVSGQKKVYVQDRLAEVHIKEKITKLLCEDEGTMYFCGSTTMAKAAGRVVTSAVQEYKQVDEIEGKAWMNDMKRSRRWQEDVWG